MCIRDRSGAQAGGGFGQTDSQPVQPVRVQPRQGTDGIRIGCGQLRKAYAAWRSQCAGLHGCAYYYPDDYYACLLYTSRCV